MKILIIEDEKDVRLNIIEILASGGFDSINAENGATGIQLAKERSPDLILCDIKMPDFDGYCVLQELRQDPKTALIPFIFLTAKADKADVRQGMNLGADDYLTKPFRRVELLDTIEARLKRHRAQLEVQKKAEALQEINAQKNDLLNTITHDLRAPLATIKVALQLMEAVPDSRRHYLEVALCACDQGDELIQNLLDLYQLESGEALATPEPLDLKEFLYKIIDTAHVRTRDCEQVLSVDIPDDLPIVMVDSFSYRRILIELLNNACKYTQTGGAIRFKIRECTNDRQLPVLKFTVSNQAQISRRNLGRVFDKFYRVPGSDRRQKGGTGLGLALVKKLVEQLQGTIEVASEDGWTTFILKLPYETL